MARSRNIKPGFFLNEDLGTADPYLQILFAGLWCLADKEGRLEDRPLRIKAEIFPYRDSLDVNRYLTELSRLGFVQRYEVGGKRYIQVINFKEHQNPHHTEKGSVIPAPCALPVNPPLDNGENPADSGFLIPDTLIPDAGSGAETKPATCTKTELAFLAVFEEKETRLRELYPNHNYEAEKETCIAHYRNNASAALDAYPLILKWFNRVQLSPVFGSKRLTIEEETDAMLKEIMEATA